MKFLQSGYNKNRLVETHYGPQQSPTFFNIWRTRGFFAALWWWYKQVNSVYKIIAQIIGCVIIAIGLVKFPVVKEVALFCITSPLAGDYGGTAGDNRYETPD